MAAVYPRYDVATNSEKSRHGQRHFIPIRAVPVVFDPLRAFRLEVMLGPARLDLIPLYRGRAIILPVIAKSPEAKNRNSVHGKSSVTPHEGVFGALENR